MRHTLPDRPAREPRVFGGNQQTVKMAKDDMKSQHVANEAHAPILAEIEQQRQTCSPGPPPAASSSPLPRSQSHTLLSGRNQLPRPGDPYSLGARSTAANLALIPLTLHPFPEPNNHSYHSHFIHFPKAGEGRPASIL
jgi:hypothetical protein